MEIFEEIKVNFYFQAIFCILYMFIVHLILYILITLKSTHIIKFICLLIPPCDYGLQALI